MRKHEQFYLHSQIVSADTRRHVILSQISTKQTRNKQTQNAVNKMFDPIVMTGLLVMSLWLSFTDSI